jgi:hypothetical protein
LSREKSSLPEEKALRMVNEIRDNSHPWLLYGVFRRSQKTLDRERGCWYTLL